MTSAQGYVDLTSQRRTSKGAFAEIIPCQAISKSHEGLDWERLSKKDNIFPRMANFKEFKQRLEALFPMAGVRIDRDRARREVVHLANLDVIFGHSPDLISQANEFLQLLLKFWGIFGPEHSLRAIWCGHERRPMNEKTVGYGASAAEAPVLLRAIVGRRPELQ